MNVTVMVARSIVENMKIEVKDFEHLKELAQDRTKLWDLIAEQGCEIVEVSGNTQELDFQIAIP